MAQRVKPYKVNCGVASNLRTLDVSAMPSKVSTSSMFHAVEGKVAPPSSRLRIRLSLRCLLLREKHGLNNVLRLRPPKPED
jgi:hypothetical protein